ncbi:hypothetical protein AeMF1_009238, partial [Aphanomyces euteiches]
MPRGLEDLGPRDSDNVDAALANSQSCHLLYLFGRREISLHGNQAKLKPWNCAEYHIFVQGYPISSFKRRFSVGDFKRAMQEAQQFSSESEDKRYLLQSLMPVEEPPQSSSAINDDEISNSKQFEIERNVSKESLKDINAHSSDLGTCETDVSFLGSRESSKEYDFGAFGVQLNSNEVSTGKSYSPDDVDSYQSTVSISVVIASEKYQEIHCSAEKTSLDKQESAAQDLDISDDSRQSPEATSEKEVACTKGNKVDSDEDNNDDQEILETTGGTSDLVAKIDSSQDNVNYGHDRVAQTDDQPIVHVNGSPVRKDANDILADVELMALAGDLGITLEADSPTKMMATNDQTFLERSINQKTESPLNPKAGNVSILSNYGVNSLCVLLPNGLTSKACNLETPITATDSVVWVKRWAGPWWPSYLCNPATIRSKLNLPSDYDEILNDVRQNCDSRLVYYFGIHTLENSKVSHKRIKKWNCSDHNELCHPLPSSFNLKQSFAEFGAALEEVKLFQSSDDKSRVLPPISGNDRSKHAKFKPYSSHQEDTSANTSQSEEECTNIPLESVAWAKARGTGPYWPVYVCNASKLRHNLQNLGNRHAPILYKVRKHPDEFRLLYFFGKRTFGIQSHPGRMKPWNCLEQQELTKGPNSSLGDEHLLEEFSLAVMEAEEYLAAEENSRLLPGMVASDLSGYREVTNCIPSISDIEPSNSKSVGDTVDKVVHSERVEQIPSGCIVWARPKGYPWWPAYVCDVESVIPYLHKLGHQDYSIVGSARRSQESKNLVFYFGRHSFGLLKSRVKMWKCQEHSLYAKGYPVESLTENSIMSLFLVAVNEALEFSESPIKSPPFVEHLAKFQSYSTSALTPNINLNHIEFMLQTDHHGEAPKKKRGRPPKLGQDRQNIPKKQCTNCSLDATSAESRNSTVDAQGTPNNETAKQTSNSDNARDAQGTPKNETAKQTPNSNNASDEENSNLNKRGAEDNPNGGDSHKSLSTNSEIPLGIMGWFKQTENPWWPIFVCNASLVREKLYYLGDAHKSLLSLAKENPIDFRLIFFFGLHKFEVVKMTQNFDNFKQWNCPEQDQFLLGFPAGILEGPAATEHFMKAIHEASVFMNSDEKSRLLPRMHPSDMNPALKPPTSTNESSKEARSISPRTDSIEVAPRRRKPKIVEEISFDSVAWLKYPKYPWWPVYVCNPSRLRPNLHHLGNRHRSMLSKAQQNPNELRLVYYFGRYIFGIVKLVNGKIKPWACEEHSEFIQGYPESAMNEQDEIDEFFAALKEAQDFLSDDESSRLLPFFVPSDMDLELEPPSISPQRNSPAIKSNKKAQEEKSDPINALPMTNEKGSSRRPVLTAKTLAPEIASSAPSISTGNVSTGLVESEEKANGQDETFLFETTEPFMLSHTSDTQCTPTNNGSEPSNQNQQPTKVAHATDKTVKTKDQDSALPESQSICEVYVCNPHNLRSELHNLGTRHNVNNNWIRAKSPGSVFKLVYYFGLYSFGLQQKFLKPWKCLKHNTFLLGNGQLATQRREIFLSSLKEAEAFDAADPDSRLPPHMVPSDLDPTLEPPALETAYKVMDEYVESKAEKIHSSVPHNVISPDRAVALPYDCVGWSKSDGYPWWPVYVCDPDKVRTTLMTLGNGHDYIVNEATKKPDACRIVYYFGSRRFGLNEIQAKTMQKWKDQNHEILLEGLPKSAMKRKGTPRVFRIAVEEAEAFLASGKTVLTFPHATDANASAEDEQYESDGRDDIKEEWDIPVDTVAWAYLSGFPWLPVYVINPFRLKANLEHLGRGHSGILEEAKLNPETFRIVYYFGSHNFGLHKSPERTMRAWKCRDHDAMCFPTPSNKQKTKSFREQVKKALSEVENYLASDESKRLLPMMVASDMEPVSQVESVQPIKNPPRGSKTSRYSREQTATKPESIKTTSSKTVPTSPARPVPSQSKKSRENVPSNESPAAQTLEKRSEKPSSKDASSKNKRRVTSKLIAYDTIAWGLLEGFPWMPVYVLDPFKLKTDLHLLGSGHQGTLRKAQQYPDRYRIVYYFGTHNFGLHIHPSTTLRPWNCEEHPSFVDGYPKASCRGKKVVEDLIDGVKEAECFAAADPNTRLLPYMVPSDTNFSLKPPTPLHVPYNSLGWAISDGYPWMPVYVFDPFQLQPKLQILGSGHRELLRRARAAPDETRIVYYFGSHSFGLHKTDGTLKPWDCPEHDQYLEAKSDSLLYIKKTVMDEFDIAMDEVEVFTSAEKSQRVLPFMDPSDVDLTAHAPVDTPEIKSVRSEGRRHSLSKRTRASTSGQRPAKRIRAKEDEPNARSALVELTLERAIEEKTIFGSMMAWVLWADVIWWPVFLCSVGSIKTFNWENEDHVDINEEQTKVLVYHFGVHSFVVHQLDQMRPWLCSEHDMYLQGKSYTDQDLGVANLFSEAVQEAQDFAASIANHGTVRTPTSADQEETKTLVMDEPQSLLDHVGNDNSGNESMSDDNADSSDNFESDGNESVGEIDEEQTLLRGSRPALNNTLPLSEDVSEASLQTTVQTTSPNESGNVSSALTEEIIEANTQQNGVATDVCDEEIDFNPGDKNYKASHDVTVQTDVVEAISATGDSVKNADRQVEVGQEMTSDPSLHECRACDGAVIDAAELVEVKTIVASTNEGSAQRNDVDKTEDETVETKSTEVSVMATEMITTSTSNTKLGSEEPGVNPVQEATNEI